MSGTLMARVPCWVTTHEGPVQLDEGATVQADALVDGEVERLRNAEVLAEAAPAKSPTRTQKDPEGS